jgi:hypothetical protein
MLLMMSENIARNMQSSQGTMHYPTELYLTGYLRKLYNFFHLYKQSENITTPFPMS